MYTTNHEENPRPTTELAAALTDLALVILKQVQVAGDSVAMELELWRALTIALEQEGTASPDAALARVVHRAVLDVATAFAPDQNAGELETRLRRWMARLQARLEQRRLMVRLSQVRPRQPLHPLGRALIVRPFNTSGDLGVSRTRQRR